MHVVREDPSGRGEENHRRYGRKCHRRMVELLARTKESGGRIFFLGVGGSAGNCSHAVNDFRKIVGLEAYAPTDNVSELTARTNDEGWETVFVEWLKVSRLRPNDVIFVFSVGGGNLEKNVRPNLVRALQYAKEIGATILGVVGRDGGYTAKVGDAVCIVPMVNPERSLLTRKPFRPSFGTFWSAIRRSRRDKQNGKGFAEVSSVH
jgi:D-sedoheptulose 7-phosphate isomerase